MKVGISTLLLGQRFSFFQGGAVYEIVNKDNIDMHVQVLDVQSQQYITPVLEIDFTEPGNPAHLPVIIQ